MSLLEINPLVVTEDGKLLCLDAKINFDSNALYRHPDIAGAARRKRGRRQGDRGLEITISPTSRSTAISVAW